MVAVLGRRHVLIYFPGALQTFLSPTDSSQKPPAMSMSSATGVFLISLLSIPILWLVNHSGLIGGNPWGILAAGYASLAGIPALAYFVIRDKRVKKDPWFYVFTTFAFSSVVDLVLCLEMDGMISGFTEFYMKEGEPYLGTAYGIMISYWDATAHYSMYLMMVAAIAWNEQYREVGLYWVGSLLHSMIVFMPGTFIGKFANEIRPAILLNIPYVVVPVVAGVKYLQSRQDSQVKKVQGTSLLKRPLDVLLMLFLLVSIGISVIRGLAVLDCPWEVTKTYTKEYEPYLEDRTAYPVIQMLVYLFYFVPYYLAAMYGLVQPGCVWMPDWALLFAGAAAQAQFSHIGSSFHGRTRFTRRVPEATSMEFWVINLLLAIVPQILAYRCVKYPSFFARGKSQIMNGVKESPSKKKDS
ncbi:PREDICTED: transmembrane 6 superfamily member 1-like isoform X2 [Branchiostoma belcheri]|uniref:Transmembrane 6 superfamily member 1-like isoform X2 n=1 Tax=Branchiostoma belcheri TaxID=7741 RepID=A0A6P4YR59_BRABE|nr:PREDICTED: transmembrane 6 superfamily member 1-like isoform X2 [Branchiostoma belcheri]